MPETIYKKGDRRKKNLVRSKNTPQTQYTSNDVEKRINERIAWCMRSYGEDKMTKLIDMTQNRNRKKALDRMQSQSNVLRSYIKHLSGQILSVYFKNMTDTTGTVLVATPSSNPSDPDVVYCKIDIQPNELNVTSETLSLTFENVRYIKRIVFLSALGQIS